MTDDFLQALGDVIERSNDPWLGASLVIDDDFVLNYQKYKAIAKAEYLLAILKKMGLQIVCAPEDVPIDVRTAKTAGPKGRLP